MQLTRRSMIRLNLMTASVLAVSGSSIFAEARNRAASPADEWFWLPGGPFTRRFGIPSAERGACSLLTCSQPQQGSLLHQHTREDELFEVVRGSFEIEVGDQFFFAGAGSSVLAPKGIPHRWTNIGAVPGQLVSTYSPGGLQKTFLSLAVPIAAPSETPIVDMSVLGPRILHHVMNAGITQAGPARFPHST